MFWKNLGLELSYGSILDDAQSEFWILRIILEITLKNFLVFCMEFEVDKGSKVTEPVF